MKKIILTGGGTAGHVTPNLALIPSLKAEGWEIHYIGTENGIERRLIEAVVGVTYHVIKSGKLRDREALGALMIKIADSGLAKRGN